MATEKSLSKYLFLNQVGDTGSLGASGFNDDRKALSREVCLYILSVFI